MPPSPLHPNPCVARQGHFRGRQTGLGSEGLGPSPSRVPAGSGLLTGASPELLPSSAHKTEKEQRSRKHTWAGPRLAFCGCENPCVPVCLRLSVHPSRRPSALSNLTGRGGSGQLGVQCADCEASCRGASCAGKAETQDSALHLQSARVARNDPGPRPAPLAQSPHLTTQGSSRSILRHSSPSPPAPCPSPPGARLGQPVPLPQPEGFPSAKTPPTHSGRAPASQQGPPAAGMAACPATAVPSSCCHGCRGRVGHGRGQRVL